MRRSAEFGNQLAGETASSREVRVTPFGSDGNVRWVTGEAPIRPRLGRRPSPTRAVSVCWNSNPDEAIGVAHLTCYLPSAGAT